MLEKLYKLDKLNLNNMQPVEQIEPLKSFEQKLLQTSVQAKRIKPLNP